MGYTITLGEFAQKLYPVLGFGKKRWEFMADLVDAGVSSEKDIEKEPDGKTKKEKQKAHLYLSKTSSETWENRYEGRDGYSRMAKKIAPFLDKPKFEVWIFDYGDDAHSALLPILRPYCPGLKAASDVPSACAELFCRIIRQAAKRTRSDAKNKIPAALSDVGIDPLTNAEELEFIIRKLSKIERQATCELEMEALSICDKIHSKHEPLIKKINLYVMQYYNSVREVLLKSKKIGRQKSNLIALDIRGRYCALAANRNLNQEQIFDAFVDWLQRQVPEASRASCEIVISFFVQNCEVFDELP